MTERRTKTVVVGGGVAGLAAAVELARAGRAVTVLEGAAHLGGRARSLGADGYVLNLGPHALYRRAERRLEALGVPVTGGIPDGGYTVEIAGRVHPMPSGLVSLLGNGGLSWTAKWQVAKVLATIGRTDPAPLDGVSVRTWLDERLGLAVEARAVVETVCRLTSYVNAPTRCSAGAAIRQIREALDGGVRYVDGGWASIVDGLHRVAREAGVEVRTGAKASAVVPNGAGGEVRLGDGGAVPFDELVLTTSPGATVALLGDAASPALRRFAEGAAKVRAACLDVALAKDPRRHPAVMLGVDRPLYFSDHSLWAELAPEGGAVLHVARYLEPEEKVDPKAERAELEGFLDLARPGWREHVVEARFAPAFTVMHAVPEASKNGLRGRPAVHEAGPDRVVLAGDWVGPTGLLLVASLESAAAAVAHLRDRARLAA